MIFSICNDHTADFQNLYLTVWPQVFRDSFWHLHKSCHMCEWGMSHVWMSHVKCMNESCHMYDWAMSHVWLSHVTCMSRVTRTNESCHTCEWVKPHVWHECMLGSSLLSVHRALLSVYRAVLSVCWTLLSVCWNFLWNFLSVFYKRVIWLALTPACFMSNIWWKMVKEVGGSQCVEVCSRI